MVVKKAKKKPRKRARKSGPGGGQFFKSACACGSRDVWWCDWNTGKAVCRKCGEKVVREMGAELREEAVIRRRERVMEAAEKKWEEKPARQREAALDRLAEKIEDPETLGRYARSLGVWEDPPAKRRRR